MHEIDPKVLEKVEEQLGIEPLKFIIGFTEKNCVIATRGGIQAKAFAAQEDPLQTVVESGFVNMRNFCVIELERGHVVQIQNLKGEGIIKKGDPKVAFAVPVCPCGAQPSGNPPQCPPKLLIG
jgi:hypothetical protein